VTAQSVPEPDFAQPFVDGDRFLTRWARHFLTGLYNRVGKDQDKVDVAHATAMAAVPQTTAIVASGGLTIGGELGNNVGVALYKVVTAVALLPATGNNLGDWAYAMDGRKNGEGAASGTGTPVYWDRTGAWKTLDTGATVAA